MRLFFALITFVILTACSSQSQVTVTREVTVTLPPTTTPLPILTPEPTDTPVPTATAPIETTEAAAPTMTLLNELGVTVGADGMVELKMDGDTVVIIEKSTGEEVGRDGLLTLDFMQEALSRTDLVGGPQEKPNPNSSRRNMPYRYGAIPGFSVELASKFIAQFKEVTGNDWLITGNPKNGRMEMIKVGLDSWMITLGETPDGISKNTIFKYIVFETHDEKIKWFEILPATVKDVDDMWKDEG